MDESIPLVSIVIPVYNGSNYLSQAIESALSQTYQNFEVIVVNDGSTDLGKTREVAWKYGDRIHYFEKNNGGVATALNLGIDKMKGEYFSWLSHDDLYYPYKVEKQVSFLLSLKREKVIVFSHENIIDASGTMLRKSYGYSFLGEEPFAYTLLYNHFLGGCSLLIPKVAFGNAGGFNPKYKTVQDYDLWFRMMEAGYSFEYCPIASGMSRRHEGQDTKTKKQVHLKEKEDLFIKIQDELPSQLWLDQFRDKVWALYNLGQKYKDQNMIRVYEYDKERVDRYLHTQKLISRIMFFCYKIFYNMNKIINQTQKKAVRAVGKIVRRGNVAC